MRTNGIWIASLLSLTCGMAVAVGAGAGCGGASADCAETCSQAANACPSKVDAQSCRTSCQASSEAWVWAAAGPAENTCAVLYVGPRSGVPCDTFVSLECVGGGPGHDAGAVGLDLKTPSFADAGQPEEDACKNDAPPHCDDSFLVECRTVGGLKATYKTFCERGCVAGECRCDRSKGDDDYCDGKVSVKCAFGSNGYTWYRYECPGTCNAGTCY